MTVDDLVRFWSRLPNGAYVHPADEAALRHNPATLQDAPLRTDHVPVPWYGPVLSADIYLLFLNPGARTTPAWERAQRDHEAVLRENLSGRENNYLFTPGYQEADGGAKWLSRVLGDVASEEEVVATRLAVIQIVAYRSRTFRDGRMVGTLASSRAMLAAVHEDLLPRARRGDILIACMRSATKWGFCRETPVPGVLMGRGREGHATANTDVGRAIRDFLAGNRVPR
jgi:hypothetical protein